MGNKTRYRFPESDLALAFPEAGGLEIGAAGADCVYGPDYIERDGQRLYSAGAYKRICQKLAGVPESLETGEVHALPSHSGAPATILSGGVEVGHAGSAGSSEGSDLNRSNGQAIPSSGSNAPPAQNSPMEMTVLRTVLNPKMLLARSDAEDVAHVVVGDSTNFIPGMKLSVLPHPTETALWKLVGPLPRDRGRW